MGQANLENLQAEISALEPVSDVGRIAELSHGRILVRGLSDTAVLGDLVTIVNSRDHGMRGEIIEISDDAVHVLPEDMPDGLGIGDRVIHEGQNEIAPDETWVGRVIDPFGLPLDGGPLMRGTSSRKLRGAPVNPTQRRGLGARLETGLAVFNTLLPIVRGQRVGLFAGSGVGKSTLLALLAQGIEADIVVIALIGERGREVREFVERVLGPEGRKKSIVVAATSDRSPLVRRRCAWAAAAVAEHFRDSGKHVLLLADSITRFAEAHREVALSAGESGSLRGYPPSTAHLITSLCERAGPGPESSGDITALFTVLVAGSDMDEPIADILRGVLDGHIVLDRQIAERGRFPAVDVLRSVSRSLPLAASEIENSLIGRARASLGIYARSEMMVQAGLYASGSDPKLDSAIRAWPQLEDFISQREGENTVGSFAKLAAILDLADSHPEEGSSTENGAELGSL